MTRPNLKPHLQPYRKWYEQALNAGWTVRQGGKHLTILISPAGTEIPMPQRDNGKIRVVVRGQLRRAGLEI
jgi:hypothetical protein